MQYKALIDSCINLAEFEERNSQHIIYLDRGTYEGFGKEMGFNNEVIESGVTIWHRGYIVRPIKASESSKTLSITIS